MWNWCLKWNEMFESCRFPCELDSLLHFYLCALLFTWWVIFEKAWIFPVSFVMPKRLQMFLLEMLWNRGSSSLPWWIDSRGKLWGYVYCFYNWLFIIDTDDIYIGLVLSFFISFLFTDDIHLSFVLGHHLRHWLSRTFGENKSRKWIS